MIEKKKKKKKKKFEEKGDEKEKEKEKKKINNKNYELNVQQIKDFLIEIRDDIIKTENKNNYDSVIIYYSGHGMTLDHIVCSDLSKIKYTEMLEFFSADHCKFLKGRPKILYGDACRGGGSIIKELNDPIGKNPGKDDDKIMLTKHHDIYMHFSTISNFEALITGDGSYFTNAIYNIYDTHLILHKNINKLTLHALSILINSFMKRNHYNQQVSEIVSRLDYEVIFALT